MKKLSLLLSILFSIISLNIYSQSCTPLILNMYDSYGDGWNGNDFSLIDSSGAIYFSATLNSGSFGTDSVCLPDGCYTVDCSGGSWQYEVSWDLIDTNGVVILSGGAPYSGYICFPTLLGCMNPLANNYDSTANIDDGSCIYDCIEVDTSESFESGQGITWMLDPNNTIDWTNNFGGTGSFNTGPSSAFDGSYYMYTEASGSGSNKEAIMYVPCIDPTQWSQLSLAFAYHMYGASMGTLSIDVSPDSGTTWIEEWTLSGDQGDQWSEAYVDLSAYTSGISVRVQGETGSSYTSDIAIDLLRFMEMPSFGCTDPFADNYDSTATYDDGSCMYIGCTDFYAINYCQACNVSDSTSCLYYGCKSVGYTEDFESMNFAIVGWTYFSGSEAAVTLNNSNAISDTVSLQFEGGTNNGWGSYLTETQAYANTEHISSASFCINLSNNTINDTLTLTFETAMWSPLFLSYSWIRVKVDGNVIADSYGNTSYNNNTLPYNPSGNTILSYDLSSFAGSSHYITLESVNKYGTSANNPTTLNNVWIDNINISLPLIGGCMDSTALNYDPLAQVDNGSCLYDIFGCTDSTALNYNPLATIDDSSCIAPIYGCTDPLAMNYSPLANIDDGSCVYPIYGCTDSTALNYDSLATVDDGSCILPVYGCTDSTATNYYIGANVDDGSCIYAGCTDSTALNYSPLATIDDSSCIYPVYGCTDSTAQNYDSLATVDDGSCIAGVFGCTDSTAINFYPGATFDDGSCIYAGCTDSTSCNYDPIATIDDGSCIYYFGCTDPLALNYDSSACVDDGSCQYMLNCTSPKPTGLYVYDLIDSRIKIGWDNMNDSSCMVWKYFVRYREVGTNPWTTKSAGVGNGLCNFGLNTTFKQLLNLNPSTDYEFKMKAFYCNGTSSNYSTPVQFTTEDVCPDMTNLTTTTFNSNQSKVRFDWDTTGTYVFARILLRVDTNGSTWQTAGGFGVYYPTLQVNKFGLTPGESYRAQGRTFCDSNITAYRSPTWTSPIFWTQPGSSRLNGGNTISNLDVYPNPSKDIFNISFNSDRLQNLNIRVINILGNVIFNEERESFIGEYIKQIDLDRYGKGMYFLEIETDDDVVNKKLMLQ
ncbi:MAG: T9SS type A sorting domain-containing protein [Flavobacteriales bacterium]|nr:T9SS type A sorting domain-containing protein [Flavobacteriales bacterium]